MTLNVNSPLSNGSTREALLGEVLTELGQINFRDWMGAFRRWHEGSLSLIHLNVLMILRSGGPLTMTHLAEMLDVSVASATGIIDRMEKKGVVERRRSEQDRRVVEVHVSEGGQQVFVAMEAERRIRLNRLVGSIPDSDLQALLTGLRAFREARERLLSIPGAERYA